ncbi:MAG: hypothetical protein AB1746_16780, partial [Candidatus Zixiibacteriota bacterium]
MKSGLLFAVVICLLLMAGPAQALTLRAEISPQLKPGVIQINTPFTVDLYMNNDDDFDHVAYSLPLYFYSPDQ